MTDPDMMHPVETRPSNAHRWAKCAAAPQFAAKAGPRPASDEAREGTAAAWVAEQVLTGAAPDCWALVGETCPTVDWPIDPIMAHHVQDYVDLCRADGGQFWAEEHVTLSRHVAGTADNITLADGRLTVRDLKYGYRLIEPDSPQLVIYAAAVLKAPPCPISTVRTEIYQPRGFHPDGPRRWIDWTVDQIAMLGEDYATKAELCHRPDPVATPGPHCLYCDAAASCPAAQVTAAQALAVVEMQGYRDRSAAELADALRFYRWASATIQAAAKSAEAEAEARVRAGENLPGWGVAPRLGQSRVAVPPDVVRALTGVSGVKEVPMNIDDLRKAGLTDDQLSVITERPNIGYKLTELDPAALLRQFKGA